MKKKYYIVTSEKLLLLCIAIFGLTSLLAQLLPFSFNRIIAVILFCIIIIKNIKMLTAWRLWTVVLLFYLLLYTFSVSNSKYLNLKNYVYYSLTVLLFLSFSYSYDWKRFYNEFKRNINIMYFFALICFFIVVLCLVLPECYVIDYTGGRYFKGFCETSHSAASTLCLVLSLLVACVIHRKLTILHIIMIGIITFAIFMTGGRTFVVPCFAILNLYLKQKIESKKIRKIAYIVLITLITIMLLKSSLMDKLFFAINSSFYGRSTISIFTSGRSEFWIMDMSAFIQGNLIQILFGRGFDFVYQYNSLHWGQAIYGHSDIVNSLLGVGLVGFFIYLNSIFKSILSIKKMKSKSIIDILMYIFFPFFINGFFVYPHMMLGVFLLEIITMYMHDIKKEKSL